MHPTGRRTTPAAVAEPTTPLRLAVVSLAVPDQERLVAGALARRGYEIVPVAADAAGTGKAARASLIVVDGAYVRVPAGQAAIVHATERAPGDEPRPSLLVLADVDDPGAVATALDLGADDVLFVPDELPALDHRLALLEVRRERTRHLMLAASELSRAGYRELLAASERQAVELRLLHEVRTAIAAEASLPEMVRAIVARVSAAFGYTNVSLYLIEDETLVLQHQVGYDAVLDRIPMERGRDGPGGAHRRAGTDRGRFDRSGVSGGDPRDQLRGLRSLLPARAAGRGAERRKRRRGPPRRRRPAPDDGGQRLPDHRPGTGRAAQRRSGERAATTDRPRRRRDGDLGLESCHPRGEMVRTNGAAVRSAAGHHRSEHRAMVRRRCIRTTASASQMVDRHFLRFGDDYEVEFRVVLPDGDVRWLTGKGKVIERGPDGEPTSVVGVTMDVTGRKRLEAERLRLVQVEAARAQAEEAQQRITDTLERLTAAFVAVDHEWRVTYLNQQATELLRQPHAALAGQVLWVAVPHLAGSEFERQLRLAVQTQTPAKFDADPAELGRWLEVHAYPSPDGLSVYLQDVTLRREAENERRRIEARFRSLVQNASDLILILDRGGTVRYASPAIERVIGYTAEEIVGGDNVHRVHPQDAKRLRRAFVEAATTPGVSPPVVLRFRHRSGAYRWIEVTTTNLFDDPTVQGLVANCRDVTERHEAEYNLWFLAETSAVLGTSLDLETTLTSVSRLIVMNLADLCVIDIVDEQGHGERTAVAHRDPALDQRLADFRARHPLDPDSRYGPGAVLRSGHSVLVPTVDDDLRNHWTADRPQAAAFFDLGVRSIIVVPLVARGTTIGVLSIASATPGRYSAVDLGLVEELARRSALAVDNARLYRAARSAVEARDQFLSVAAHELRTPITAITGFSALLDREVNQRKDPERIARYVRRLTDAGDRLSLLVDDMLDVSRIRLGQLPLRIDSVDLGDLVRRVVQRYEEQELHDRQQLVLVAPSFPCPVPADEDRLEQVLSNLLENAVKYSAEGGRIIVSLAVDEAGYRIAVRDEGIGLPLVEIDSIFRPFGRAANAVASNLPGLGIGLYICRNIVERHGGRIWAESEGEGTGTTFVVWLPLAGPGRYGAGE